MLQVLEMSDPGVMVPLVNLSVCSHVAQSERLDFSSGSKALDGCEVETAIIATNATNWTRFSCKLRVDSSGS